MLSRSAKSVKQSTKYFPSKYLSADADSSDFREVFANLCVFEFEFERSLSGVASGSF